MKRINSSANQRDEKKPLLENAAVVTTKKPFVYPFGPTKMLAEENGRVRRQLLPELEASISATLDTIAEDMDKEPIAIMDTAWLNADEDTLGKLDSAITLMLAEDELNRLQLTVESKIPDSLTGVGTIDLTNDEDELLQFTALHEDYIKRHPHIPDVCLSGGNDFYATRYLDNPLLKPSEDLTEVSRAHLCIRRQIFEHLIMFEEDEESISYFGEQLQNIVEEFSRRDENDVDETLGSKDTSSSDEDDTFIAGSSFSSSDSSDSEEEESFKKMKKYSKTKIVKYY